MARIKCIAIGKHECESDDPVGEPPAKRIIHDFNDMITVPIGEQEQRFTVHRDMICAKSNFFKAACSERWARGDDEKVVRPPEVTADDFQIYAEWVYTFQIAISATDILKKQLKLMDMHIVGDVLDDH